MRRIVSEGASAKAGAAERQRIRASGAYRQMVVRFAGRGHMSVQALKRGHYTVFQTGVPAISMRFPHPGASFPKASESKNGQNMTCVQPARVCAVQWRALFMVAVFFLPLIPLFQAFQERVSHGWRVKPQAQGSSPDVPVLRMRLTP